MIQAAGNWAYPGIGNSNFSTDSPILTFTDRFTTKTTNMKNVIFRAVKSLTPAVLFCLAMQVQGFTQGFSPSTIARLQFVIDSFQNNPANPYVGGMTAAINVDGLASWRGATGFAARNVDAQNNLLPGGSPFTVSTLSRMYSVTKTFTASLVLELAKQGVFNLESPVSSFLPLNLINPGLNSSVTIRQLLAHESGYSDYTDEMQLQIAVAFQPTHSWTAPEIVSFAHQINAPGTIRKYSSTNYIILGAIVETVTHKPVEQHFRQRFFNPLHLRSMFLAEREPLWPGAVLASPHDNLSPFNPIFQLTGQPTFPDAYTNVSVFPFTAIASAAFTGGGIVTNIADMAEWGNTLYGGRATSRPVLEQMLHSISSTPDEDGDYLGYGIIRSVKISATDVFVGHDGNGPGYRSVMFYQPDRKMTIAILTNFQGAKLYDVAKALYASLPDFLCGDDRREDDQGHDSPGHDEQGRDEKVLICFNGHNLCIPRQAAAVHISHGAYLGGCSARHHHEDNNDENDDAKIVNTIAQKLTLTSENSLTAFPNPFSDKVSISFTVPSSGNASISLYDINGKLVAPVFNGFVEKGALKKVELDSRNLPAGIYFTRLQTREGVKQQKIVLIRQ
jgi:D-alanyl-D-alanine carboxypeptidase